MVYYGKINDMSYRKSHSIDAVAFFILLIFRAP